MAPALPPPAPARVDEARIDAVARLLRAGEPAVLILRDRTVGEDGLRLVYAIGVRTGADLLVHQSNARLARGRGRVPVEQVPYAVADAVDRSAQFRHVVLVGATDPVAFFAYPSKPGRLTAPDAPMHRLASPASGWT